MKKSLGTVLRNARSRKKYTQRKVAELTDLTPAAISQFENDQRQPRPENLEKLSLALDIPLAKLESLITDRNGRVAHEVSLQAAPLHTHSTVEEVPALDEPVESELALRLQVIDMCMKLQAKELPLVYSMIRSIEEHRDAR